MTRRASRQPCLVFVVLGAVAAVCLAASPEEWRGRTIYQVLTDRFAREDSPSSGCGNLGDYCGGTFRGLMDKLDYISELGFDAIWISPVVLNFDHGYHGYWAKDIYQINPNFGSADDLKLLVKKCHDRGIWVMVDVVGNHMGCTDCRTFEQLYPFNATEHYHSYCIINDWTNQHEVEYCRLAGLPDLDQDNAFVRATLKQWIADLVPEFGFDGVRIDTIPEVSPDFWDEFTASAGVYTTGEVFNGDLNYVQPYETHVGSVLNYPLYYVLRNVFTAGYSMRTIESDFYQRMGQWKSVDMNPVFVDNHDNARFLNTEGDQEKYKNALTFVLCSTIPIIYYGTEQGYAGGGDPNNRESLWPNYGEDGDLFKFVKTTVAMRKSHTSDLTQAFVQRYADDTFYAFSRGSVLAAMTNQGSTADTLSRTLTYHPYKAGDVVCNIYYEGDCVKVGANGLVVTLMHGESKVFVPADAPALDRRSIQGSLAPAEA